MELRHLRYFVAVAEELNFRKAAERLHVAQPALSSQIRNLEQELGVRLFERTTRSVLLTQTGQVFLTEARGILGAATHAEQLVRKAESGLVGMLRLGVITPAAGPLLAKVLRNFHQKYPGVQLSLSGLTSVEQLRRLRAGELDVGVMRPQANAPDMDMQFVEQAPLVLALPSGHRLARKRRLEWKDFDGEGLVMIDPDRQHGFYNGFLTACAKAGAKTHVAQYAQDVQIKMWLISAGFGIAPLTATLIEIRRPGLVFRPLPPGLPTVHTVVVWRRVDANSPMVKNFLDCFAALK
ncbi:MAG TPA: LysR substrate-binding domain-containing protein [Candidatus Angelobacter sp.]|nr:LysR substrate-binding domain-containing protein [Candidatus Angelobacter sp.]